MSFSNNKRIKHTPTGGGDMSLEIKRECEFENSGAYEICWYIRIWAFAISLILIAVLFLEIPRSIIAIISYILVPLIQILFFIPAILRYRKIRVHGKKYNGKTYANDPAIIDQLSELYLKESKTLTSLFYQFFFGIRWTKTGTTANYFEQHMRAVRWSLFMRIYWFCIFIGATLTVSLIVYMQTKNIGAAITSFAIPSIVFSIIFLFDIKYYKKRTLRLKIIIEKYNKSPSVDYLEELKTAYSECKLSIAWDVITLWARYYVWG